MKEEQVWDRTWPKLFSRHVKLEVTLSLPGGDAR